MLSATMQRERGVDPRLRIVFLLGIAIAAIFVKKISILLALVGVESVVWLAVGLGPRRLIRQVLKLWAFALLVLGSYALLDSGAEIDDYRPLVIAGLSIKVNVGGMVVGGRMLLRVLAVIMASQIARAGNPRAIAHGLERVGLPRAVAATVDAVLALAGGGGGGGRGRGQGGGGGRRRGGGGGQAHDDDAGAASPKAGFWSTIKRIGSGDVSPIVERIDASVERAERHVERSAGATLSRHTARDAAVIAGFALTMLGIKALKILPSLPFAPGHKLVVLTPIYVAAAVATRTRHGATFTGLTMGAVAFLMGDGRYGLFEILKHVTPGIVCDIGIPLMVRPDRLPGRLSLSAFGGLIGASRFATIFCVTWLVQPPALAYAILIPGMLIHTSFGIASGYISFHLVRALAAHPRWRAGLLTEVEPNPTRAEAVSDSAPHSPPPPSESP